MIPGEFVIDGKSSLDFNTVIQDRPLINSPIRKVDRRESSGRSGQLMTDKRVYRDSDLELILYTSPGNHESEHEYRSELFELFDTGGYVEVRFYFDPDKIYRVSLKDESVQFESKYYYDGGQSWKVPLDVYPWKHYHDVDPITLTEKGTINNQYSSESQPLITLEGSGNVTLIVNDEQFIMKDVPTTKVYIDSELSMSYSLSPSGSLISENSIVYTRKYPILKKGLNDISWTGDVSKLTIDPRWRDKV